MRTKAHFANATSFIGCGGTLLCVLAGGCVSPTLEVAAPEDMQRIERILERAPDDRTHAITRQHAHELADTPLRFVGRVVDPQGNGIPDAKVVFSVFDRVLEPFHFPYFGYTRQDPLQSDKDGYFRLPNQNGVGFHVDVSKDAYTPVDLNHRTYQIEHVLPAAGHYEMPGEGDVALFTLRPAVATNQIRIIATGAVGFNPDGTLVEVSLDSINPHGELPGHGDLSIGCVVGNTRDATYAWNCRVSVPGGGAQMQSSLDFIEAPESGYQTQIELGFAAEDPEWVDRIDEGLFVKLASGQYGYITLKVRTRGDQYFALQGRLNEHGSRRLE